MECLGEIVWQDNSLPPQPPNFITVFSGPAPPQPLYLYYFYQRSLSRLKCKPQTQLELSLIFPDGYIYKQERLSSNMEKAPTREDLIYDACCILPHLDRPTVTRYVSAIIDCDFSSDAVPQCLRSYKRISGTDAVEGLVPDIIMIVSDFCELPPMLPYIHSYIDALWALNRGEAVQQYVLTRMQRGD